MFHNVNIINTGIYHPSCAIHNSFFIEHFNKMNIKVDKLMNTLGREVRYLAKEGTESSITMATEAAKEVLRKSCLDAKNIDMLVFVSDTPEYTYPSNALIIQNQLGAKNAHVVFDMNSNCIGMLSALDNVSRYLKANPSIKYALITSGVMVSNIVRKDDPITYPNFSDGGAAIILKNEKSEDRIGFIDANYYTDSSLYYTVNYPAVGFSHIFDNKISDEDKKLKFLSHDVSYFSDIWKYIIKSLLDRNKLDINEIDHYIFSQFNKSEIEETLVKLKVNLDKYTFVGYKYGYTGATSPIFALDEALKTNVVKKGMKVIFCSVGIGFTMCAVLYQF